MSSCTATEKVWREKSDKTKDVISDRANMQHHPGSWYIPWGVPLQKMLAVPFNPAAAGYQPQIAAAAVQQAQAQPPPNQTQQSPYSHHQLQAMHHNHAAAAIHQQLNQQLHPAAAAAMFTPLTLRSFVAHPHMNLSQQQMQSAGQQQPQQPITSQNQSQLTALNLNNVGVVPVRQTTTPNNTTGLILPMRKVVFNFQFHWFRPRHESSPCIERVYRQMMLALSNFN